MMNQSSIRFGCAFAAVALLAGCGHGMNAMPSAGAGSSTTLQQTSVALNPVNFAITAASISKGSKSVTIVLTKVNGKKPPKGIKTSVSANLKKCAKGCTVAGPASPAGKDLFTLTIYDQLVGKKKAHPLATGTATGKIKASKKPQTLKVTLAKIPASLAFGTIPSATAGTAFSAPQPLPLTVADADGNPIVGTYASAITVTDSDTSPISVGSYLVANGSSPARSVTLTSSSSSLALGYGGAALTPVTLTASATGVTSATATFAPTNPAIAYTGPTVNGNPEIDLYATSGTGSSAGFSLAQAGFSGGSFSNNFTYATGGSANNCTSYTISPASGAAGPYTVTATATAVVGKCTLTFTGGGGNTLAVLLTYTTSGIGVNLHHRPR